MHVLFHKRTLLPLALAGALLAACSPAGQAATPTTVAVLDPVQAGNLVTADAAVVPIRQADLTLVSGGMIDEVLVTEGQQVTEGELLLRLNTARLEAQIAQAEAQVAQAEASYQQLLDGATAEEVAISEAQLRQAQAQLLQTQGSVTSADLSAAEARLAQARAQLNVLLDGAEAADINAAQARLEQAQANLQTQRDQLSAAKTRAELDMQRAVEALTQAQSAFVTAKQQRDHVVANNTDPLAGFPLTEAQKQQYLDRFVQAESAMRSAEVAVEQARVAFDNARQAEVTGIAAAEQQVAQAQADIDKLNAGARADEIAAARASVASAEADLAKLRGDQRVGTLESAQAAVAIAEANLAKLKAGASESQLQVAQAEVLAAQAALRLAQVSLEEAELRAPFAGNVALIDLDVGEFVGAGMVAIQLADFSAWELETTDLTELDVVRIAEGDPVVISFDALPDLQMTGTVRRIRPLGVNKQGDITYTVLITPSSQDPRLRWNMTAAVTIGNQ